MSEPLDRNKSPLTHTATATTAAWMDGIGVKPIADEVPVSPGWVADLAGCWMPTMTECKQSKFFRAIDPSAVASKAREQLDRAYRLAGDFFTITCEVKTSRADFRADDGRKYQTDWKGRQSLAWPSHMCILAAPASIIPEKASLYGWAVLALSEDGSRVQKFQGGWDIHPQHPGDIASFVLAIAMRQHNRHQYEHMRRVMKAHRASAARLQETTP